MNSSNNMDKKFHVPKNVPSLIIYSIFAIAIVYMYGIKLFSLFVLGLGTAFFLTTTIVEIVIYILLRKQVRRKLISFLLSGTAVTVVLSYFVFEVKVVAYIVTFTFLLTGISIFSYLKSKNKAQPEEGSDGRSNPV